MSKEEIKLALEGAANYIDALGGDSRKYRQALAEQPAQQEPVECQYGKGGYACCEGGPCKADEQNNAPQPAQQELVAWRDHVEQRLRTWRQSFVNRSGDQLALDDFMDKQSLDDLIDFVCDEYTSPPAQRTWVGLTDCEREKLRSEADEADAGYRKLIKATEAKLREKNV